MVVYILLRVVHIACAAVWFGAPLGLVKLLKMGLERGPDAFRMSAAVGAKRGAMAGIAGVLTLLTGLAMVFHLGGFGSVAPQIHGAILIALVMLGISVGVLKPMGAELSEIAEKGLDEAGRTRAQAILKKMGPITHSIHGLWLLLLVLMYWR
jgi:uncharacterized membrane protein